MGAEHCWTPRAARAMSSAAEVSCAGGLNDHGGDVRAAAGDPAAAAVPVLLGPGTERDAGVRRADSAAVPRPLNRAVRPRFQSLPRAAEFFGCSPGNRRKEGTN